jgi:hypothetical protein
MHRPSLRIVTENGASVTDTVPTVRGAHVPLVQWSLINPDAPGRILCLPMGELHGDIFTTHLSTLKPRAVVDLRPYPYFDLVTVDRSRAFALFAAIGASYIHDALSLRMPVDQAARWTIRRLATELLERIEQATGNSHGPFAFLVNARSDADTLWGLLCDGRPDTEHRWSIESA